MVCRVLLIAALWLAGCEFPVQVADGPGVTGGGSGSGGATGSGGSAGTGGGTTSQCGPCQGCCDRSFCVNGTSVLQCGRGGQLCGQCQSNEQCLGGVCTRCSSANCAGCCNSFGECLAGDSALECGRRGASCQLCSGFQQCVSGACQ